MPRFSFNPFRRTPIEPSADRAADHPLADDVAIKDGTSNTVAVVTNNKDPDGLVVGLQKDDVTPTFAVQDDTPDAETVLGLNNKNPEGLQRTGIMMDENGQPISWGIQSPDADLGPSTLLGGDAQALTSQTGPHADGLLLDVVADEPGSGDADAEVPDL
jgi:hypothetical protein